MTTFERLAVRNAVLLTIDAARAEADNPHLLERVENILLDSELGHLATSTAIEELDERIAIVQGKR